METESMIAATSHPALTRTATEIVSLTTAILLTGHHPTAMKMAFQTPATS